MALAPRLDLRQSQQLVMTPQLQQAIKLLQLSNLDLAAYVEQELEKNPLLERTDATAGDDDYLSYDEGTDVAIDADGPALEEWHVSEDVPLSLAENAAIDTDTECDNIYTNDPATDAPESAFDADGATTGFLAANSGSASFSGTDISLENTLSSDVSLQDHIAAQVNLLPLSAADKI